MAANFMTKIMRTGILAALLTLGACGDNDSTPIVSEASHGQALSLAPTHGGVGTTDYRLGPNDRTRIIVFGQPTLTGEFVLDGNGMLSYPLIGNVDANGMTPLHHAASRGDNEMILYLVSKGADVKAVSRRGQTVVDLANGPVQRLRPFPETIALLEKLGAKNSHKCVSC